MTRGWVKRRTQVWKLAIPLAFALNSLGGCAPRSAPKPTPKPKPAPSKPAPGQAGGPVRRDTTGAPVAAGTDSAAKSAAGGTKDAIKVYSKVITSAAKTRRGLFITHEIGEKLYFEIPRRELNKDMLLVGRYTRTAAGQDVYGGDKFSEATLRWEQKGTRIFLRTPSFNVNTDTAQAMYKAVMSANQFPIIAAFDVESFGPDSAPVIEVSSLYTGFGKPFGPLSGVDKKRSFLDRVAAFPDNVEIEATLTGSGSGSGEKKKEEGVDLVAREAAPVASAAAKGGMETIVAHWSMVRLPEQPMMQRWYDERVGYFSDDQLDFGTSDHHFARRNFAVRWRLEKKDPKAALSEPVAPIVYYIDPATPEVWKPWIKYGVEVWQAAFEEAGFKNAIIAKEPPTDDPDWSPEDVRHTVVRWLPSTTKNAEGPNIHDPRSGEILNGSIRMFHGVLDLARNWYFTQVAPLDPRAQQLPLPDSLLGRLLAFVVTHEVGHTLGLRHNQKGSSLYSADSVRSRSWIAKMGHSPSIMDYARFNYVAQPEDSIPLLDLIPKIGPYDKFAIMWGYKPIPEARTPSQELATLDNWARVQDTVPWLRFAESSNGDYSVHTEAVGDENPVTSTGYGLKNLRRVIQLIPSVAIAPGKDNALLKELYSSAVGQWSTEMRHVVSLVAGSQFQAKSGSQPGAVYAPVSRERQAAAVRFVNEQVFKTPTYLIDTRITSRLEPNGAVSRIRSAQQQVLSQLFSSDRIDRLVEYETRASRRERVYTAMELLKDLRRGVWSELSSSQPEIDVYRRNLQRNYIDIAGRIVSPAAAKSAPPSGPPSGIPTSGSGGGSSSSGDARPLVRGELVQLRRSLATAIGRAKDPMTRLHLEDIRAQIDGILDEGTKGE